MAETPLILGRYRPLVELGRGSAGRVLLAYDTRMARRVAIKVLPLSPDAAHAAADPDGLAEGRTAAMLNHPNIVTVYDWDTDDGDAYLVMEAVDGVSLAQILDDLGTPIESHEVAAVIADVAEALRFAHANGVLHLDIKPENVLVTRDGLAKVADFGVARLTDIAGTATGVAGTPGFMAPEQLRCEPVDERADVWALGALAYLMLTGHEPFPAGTVGEALAAATGPAPRPPSRFDHDLDPAVDDVVLVALAPDSDHRQASSTIFAEELLAVLPDPAEGRDTLAQSVQRLAEDEYRDADEAAEAPIGLWDVALAYDPWLRRGAAAGACLGLGWAGFSGLPIPQAAAIASTAMVAIAGGFAPGLGLALAFIALACAVTLNVGLWQGIAVAVAMTGLWFAGGRRAAWPVIGGLWGPPLAALRLAPVAPGIFGFFMTPLAAAGASALSGWLVMLGSASSGYGPPFLKIDPSLVVSPWGTITSHTADLPSLFQPAALLMVMVWAAAGAAGAFIARRGGRIAGVLGMVVSTAVLAGGYVLWSSLRTFDLQPADVLTQLGFALFVGLIIALVGPPPRIEVADLPFDEELDPEAEGS